MHYFLQPTLIYESWISIVMENNIMTSGCNGENEQKIL